MDYKIQVKYLYYFILMLLSVFSSEYINYIVKKYRTYQAERELRPYVNYFKHKVSPYYDKEADAKLELELSYNLNHSEYGKCIKYNYSKRNKIIINLKKWTGLSPLKKKILMLHELGHCLCDIKHEHIGGKSFFNEDGTLSKIAFLSDGCPQSIMYDYLINQYCYEKHYEYYINTLKTQCAIKYYESNN